MKKLYFAAVSVIALSMTACDPAVDEVDNNPIQLSTEQLDSRVTISQDGSSEKFTFTTSPSTYVQIRYKSDSSLLAAGTNGSFKTPVFLPGEFFVQTLNTNGEYATVEKSFNITEWEVTNELETLIGGDFDNGKKWTWDTDLYADDKDHKNAVWGNAGYCATSETDIFDGNHFPGKWWGCTPTDVDEASSFSGQLQHSNTGVLTGEEESGAYMVFNRNKLLKYKADGTLLNTGTFSTDSKKNVIGTDFGYLNTSEGAILWPFKINGDGYRPTSFEIAFLSDSKLQLIYADAGTGGWGECTWWAFKAKE